MSAKFLHCRKNCDQISYYRAQHLTGGGGGQTGVHLLERSKNVFQSLILTLLKHLIGVYNNVEICVELHILPELGAVST
jgi:hypothetical protein